jgi:hypothetical protein
MSKQWWHTPLPATLTSSSLVKPAHTDSFEGKNHAIQTHYKTQDGERERFADFGGTDHRCGDRSSDYGSGLTMAVDNSTAEIVEAVDRLSKAAKSPYWADMAVGITAVAALLVTIGTLLYQVSVNRWMKREKKREVTAGIQGDEAMTAMKQWQQ